MQIFREEISIIAHTGDDALEDDNARYAKCSYMTLSIFWGGMLSALKLLAIRQVIYHQETTLFYHKFVKLVYFLQIVDSLKYALMIPELNERLLLKQ